MLEIFFFMCNEKEAYESESFSFLFAFFIICYKHVLHFALSLASF